MSAGAETLEVVTQSRTREREGGTGWRQLSICRVVSHYRDVGFFVCKTEEPRGFYKLNRSGNRQGENQVCDDWMGIMGLGVE